MVALVSKLSELHAGPEPSLSATLLKPQARNRTEESGARATTNPTQHPEGRRKALPEAAG